MAEEGEQTGVAGFRLSLSGSQAGGLKVAEWVMESCERRRVEDGWMPAEINPVQLTRIIRRNTCFIDTILE